MLLTPIQPDTSEHLTNNYDEYQPLLTKFISPVSGQIIQTRTRLLALLQQGLSYPLVLVSAPAGSGKTTLLSQWIESLADEHISTVWVSLDATDNDPLCFWNVLLTALTQKIPAFRSVQWKKEKESTSTLLKRIINISATQQEPMVLMLDDFHTVTDSTIQEQMTYLIEYLSPHMHIVISTRVDPHLPLARLRMRGRVLEVRMDALRFTCEEATYFLGEVMHLSLTEAEITYLVNHVDGWIAGLRLAGCAMYKPHAAESVYIAAHGKQRYILDYILEEVLSAQEEHIQTFLLRTAFLPHFSASLCDMVLERQDSWQILRQIERANLFLIAEDDKRQWYHYQPLFAQALLSRLEHIDHEMQPELQHRARQWYEQHDLLVEDHNALEPEERNTLPLSPPQGKKVHEVLQGQQYPPAQHILDPLSAREIEVLQLMARGETNGEIARNLIIAPATVKRHVSNILSKLQATNRTQAVAYARHLNLLP